MINKRVMKIIDILLQKDEYITIDTISKDLEVSNKTIRNDLQLVQEWLAENDLKLIKKTGVGVTIEGPKDNKLRIADTLKQKNKELIDFSPDARKIYIAMRLLTSEHNYRIYELANELYVSRATIHKDINEVSKLLNAEKIKLFRKNNNGLHIEGKERNKRNLLLELMVHDNGYHSFANIVNNDAYECDGSMVFEGLDINDDEIKEFVTLLRNSMNPYLSSLTFDSLIFVLLHILISLLRVQSKQYVTLSKHFIKELENQPLYEETHQITDTLSKHYDISFNETEIRYLQVYFVSMQNSKQINKDDEKEAKEIYNALITSWSEQLQLPFHEDKNLYKSLYSHLYPAVTRFRHNIGIENPLIIEIKKLYKNTYKIVEKSVDYINNTYDISVSEDEIGYLTLHLAAALEHFKEPLHTILVCNGGMGTSTLLTQKLMRQIPEIEIVSQASFISIYEESLQHIDLIISTVELHLQTSVPILKISPILEDYDIVRLKDIVKEYYKIKNDPLLRKMKDAQ
ncbi:transcriptional antiterminator [Breznakia sp. PF5-3]|uniref:BglG family transcription antiterminator n=1 Tax=unclassified Breznakia TaxID=2623764 RepID=UPI002405D951|nr:MULTISPECIES: transcription antiterminator [unclassified Breznakia]MDF9825485.1 transcriptional antiterminator [Breznakia sp. PM6-1]MDF9836331.1 transcriptional antiterminator [Breznakia sp. PF5-3]MDL2276779.1 transcription antiterminator [Breznakia sp. OttesenSCG-928-G09]